MSATLVDARTLQEALAAAADGARPVAGGTDLVVGGRSGAKPLPDALVAIHRLEELRKLESRTDGLSAGALVSHAALSTDPDVLASYTALADASAIVGSHATRAHGTLGGNIMNASPAMDTGGALLCLGATVTLTSAAAASSRELALDELWTGPGETSAAPGELLTSVWIPRPAAGTGSVYVRLEYRRQMEIAVVGAAVVVALEGDVVSSARVAITALAPTIRRVPEAEAVLVGSDGGADAARAAGDAAASAATPISDTRGSDSYRRAMAAVICRRAVAAAVARARGGAHSVPIPASPALHGAA